MQYYGGTHKAFLLLSSLRSSSRSKLDEFYDFIFFMRKNRITSFLFSAKLLSIPSDLFCLDISEIELLKLPRLYKIYQRLERLKGWTFEKHYMHSKIMLKDWICFDSSQIDKLSKHAAVLQSIQVRLTQNPDQQISLFSLNF